MEYNDSNRARIYLQINHSSMRLKVHCDRCSLQHGTTTRTTGMLFRFKIYDQSPLLVCTGYRFSWDFSRLLPRNSVPPGSTEFLYRHKVTNNTLRSTTEGKIDVCAENLH